MFHAIVLFVFCLLFSGVSVPDAFHPTFDEADTAVFFTKQTAGDSGGPARFSAKVPEHYPLVFFAKPGEEAKKERKESGRKTVGRVFRLEAPGASLRPPRAGGRVPRIFDSISPGVPLYILHHNLKRHFA